MSTGFQPVFGHTVFPSTAPHARTDHRMARVQGVTVAHQQSVGARFLSQEMRKVVFLRNRLRVLRGCKRFRHLYLADMVRTAVCLLPRLIREDWKSDTRETAPEGVMDVYTLHKSLFEVRLAPQSSMSTLTRTLCSWLTYGLTASAPRTTRYARACAFVHA